MRRNENKNEIKTENENENRMKQNKQLKMKIDRIKHVQKTSPLKRSSIIIQPFLNIVIFQICGTCHSRWFYWLKADKLLIFRPLFKDNRSRRLTQTIIEQQGARR